MSSKTRVVHAFFERLEGIIITPPSMAEPRGYLKIKMKSNLYIT